MRKFTTILLSFGLLLALFTIPTNSMAQTPQYEYGLATSNNIFPLNSSTTNKVQWLYIMNEFDTPVPAGNITKIYVKRSDNYPNPSTFTNLKIRIGHIPATMTQFVNNTFLTNELDEVFLSATYSVAGGLQDEWVGFELDTPFAYDGSSNMVLEISQTGVVGGFSIRNVLTGTTNRRIYGDVLGTTGNLVTGPVDLGLDFALCDLSVDLGPDVAFCEGESITLDAGNPGANYEWSNNTTSQTLTVTQAGTYYVHISEGNCEATDTVVVNVHPLPMVDLGNDLTVCEGEMVNLDAGNPGASYEWSNNSTNQSIDINQEGVYYVTVTDANGCSSSDTISIDNFPYPSSNGIIAEEQAGCSFIFSANNVQNTTLYQWNFGDGSAMTTGMSPSHTYAESGIYTVSLTLKNECDNEITITSSVICEKGVGITELNKNTFDIYPNPTKDLINIVNTQNHYIKDVSIYDVVGKKVMEIQPDNNTHLVVNLAHLPNGMYHIHINTEEGALVQKVHVLK